VFIQSLRPIYLTRNGKTLGAVQGVGGEGATHIEAKPGYAVGRIYCKESLRLNSLTITYMKLTPGGLDPNDSYEGPCYGVPGGSGEAVIGGGGTMIVGLVGGVDNSGYIRAPGAVTLVPKP
jgi:hypothetical protein